MENCKKIAEVMDIEDIIYKVYLFCAIEAATYKSEDDYFQKVYQRTAMATGVTEAYIFGILDKRSDTASFNERLETTIKKKLQASDEEETNIENRQNKQNKSENWPPFINVKRILQDESASAAVQSIQTATTCKHNVVDKNIKERRIIKIRRLKKHEINALKEKQNSDADTAQSLKIHRIESIQKMEHIIKPTAQQTPISTRKIQTKILVKAASTKISQKVKSSAVKSKSKSLAHTQSKNEPLMIKAAISQNTNSIKPTIQENSIKIARIQSNDGTLLVKAATPIMTPIAKSAVVPPKLIKILPKNGNFVLKATLPPTVQILKPNFQTIPMTSSKVLTQGTFLSVHARMPQTVAQSKTNLITQSQIPPPDKHVIIAPSVNLHTSLKTDHDIQVGCNIRQQDFQVGHVYAHSMLDINDIKVEEEEFIVPDI